MKIKISIICLPIFFMFVSANSFAIITILKYVDKNGRVTYSDKSITDPNLNKIDTIVTEGDSSIKTSDESEVRKNNSLSDKERLANINKELKEKDALRDELAILKKQLLDKENDFLNLKPENDEDWAKNGRVRTLSDLYLNKQRKFDEEIRELKTKIKVAQDKI